MKPRFIKRFASSAAIVVCASLCAAASASADQTWTGATDALWTTAANWNTTTPGSGDVVIFNASSTANLATTLGADFSVLGLSVVDPAAAVSVATGNTLTLGSSGIDMSTATQSLTINAPVTLGAAHSWNVATGRTLTVNGIVGGTVGLTKAGGGDLSLVGANTFTGGVALNAGRLRLRNGNGAGATGNPITALDGTIILVDNSAFPGNPVTVSGTNANLTLEWGNSGGLALTFAGSSDQKITAGGSYSLNFSNSSAQFQNFLGTVDVPTGKGIQFRTTTVSATNGGPNTSFVINGNVSTRNGMNVALGALTGSGKLGMGTSGSNNIWLTYHIGEKGLSTTFDGAIVDGDTATGKRVAINKKGGGSLKLTGTHVDGLTYTGTTTITEGALIINGTKSGTGATNVNGTTTQGTLGGTGSIAGTTTVLSGGTIAPGDGGVGNLTCSNLNLASGSILDIEFGTGNDTVTVSSGGTLTLNNGATVDVNGFDTDGTYTIINTTGATVSGAAATALTAVNGNASKIYSFSDTGSAIRLTISSTDPNNYWNFDGGGTWGTAGNWTKSLVPNAAGAIARFGPGVGGAGGFFTDFNLVVTLDGNRTVGTLAIDDAFDTEITIESGDPAGSLLFDNAALLSNLTIIAGNHFIEAPVIVDAEDLAVDVATASSLTVNGTVSGTGAALFKSGAGTLTLNGDNSYNGGTQISGGVISINSATSLGNVAGELTFAGGTLQLSAPLAGVTRNYRVSGSSNALINTNGNDFGYDGVISPATGGGTGGLTKIGAGTLTLSTTQAYTGTTTVDGGTLAFSGVGAAMTLGAVNTTIAGGGLIHILNGGSLSATTSNLGPQTGGLFMDTTSGLVTFSGALTAMNTSSNGNSPPIRVAGGTLSVPSIQLGRTGLNTDTEPSAAPVNTNLYVNGGSVNVSGNLIVGTSTGSSAPNSSVVTRVDAGTLTVGGVISVGLNNGGRWSYIDVNGGTLVNTSTGLDSGVVLGGSLEGKAAFLMRAGTATVERIQFGRAAVNGTALLKITGGELYVGSEGISLGSTGTYNSEIRLAGGALGAKANWSSSLPVTVAGGTIKAADAVNASFDISLSGVFSGTGGFAKTGGGTLTLGGVNTYTGTTSVDAGSLVLADDAQLRFAPTGNGVSNKVTGAASATFDGDFSFDLSGADLTTGNTWSIVDVTSKSFSSTFSVAGFTADGDGITHTLVDDDKTWKFREDTGVLSLTIGSGPTYASWAATNVGGAAANVDTDLDGVSNGVEYFMNAAAGFTANPALNASKTVTWTNGGNIPASAYGTQYVVQTSSDLVNWTPVPVEELVTNTDGPGGSLSYTLTGTGKRFVRLKVTPN